MIDGIDVTQLPMYLRARNGISYLPQEWSVFHGLSAEDNIASIFEIRDRNRAEARRRARKVLGGFGFRHVAGVPASRLSGGEQRRMEVARCLASNPRYVLLDEPFAGLDPFAIETLHRGIVELRARGIGVLLTDHNVIKAPALCDRAFVLCVGRVLAHGTSAELLVSPSVRARFLADAFDAEPTSLAER